MKARIAVVGIGWWATFNHIPTVQASDEAEIVAICDLDPERLRIAGEKFGISSQYTNVSDMLAKEKPDGVMISTPHIAHAAPAIAALNAGCHVLVEKPMATTAQDIRAIAAAADKAGREVLIPTGMNFTAFTQTAANWVRTGRIGHVRHAVCQMGSALEDLFAGEPMLETADHLFRPPASTWADPAKAGGYGWGQMSHSIAWLVHVAGLSFESVFCMDVKSKTGVDYYDAAVARTTSGATVCLSGSSTVPKHKGLQLNICIYGSEGMIVFDNMRPYLALHRLDGNDEALTLSHEHVAYDGALPVKVFARLCAGQSVVNASNVRCGAQVASLLDAMYRSAATGQPVPVED